MSEYGKKTRQFRLFGLEKAVVAEKLENFSGTKGPLNCEYFPELLESLITISIKKVDDTRINDNLDRLENEIRSLFGPFLFTDNNESMEEIAGKMLIHRGLTVSVAESCTGGLISNRFTNIPGSSGYFLGGVVVYGNQSKVDFLDIPRKIIEKHGAVSDPVVRAMAQGVKKRFKSDLGLAVTGIAGPDGGSREKPVGTVFIGLASGNNVFSSRYRFSGPRDHVKNHTATMTLDWIRRYLNGDSFIPGL